MRWLKNFYRMLMPRTLRESEQQFHLLLDGIADLAIFMLDTKGRVTSWSVAAEKIFGYTEHEARGRHFSFIYPLGNVQAQEPQQELTLAAVHGRHEDIGWRMRGDGSRFWANSVICPVWGYRRRREGFSVITRDLTERRKAEDELRRREEELQDARKMEAIGRLAGGVAHDFNNLITGIIGLAEEIQNDLEQQNPHYADLDEIVKAANRAATLTRQLLAFGRRQVGVPKVVNFNSIVTDLIKILRGLAGADIDFETELGEDVGCVRVDPSHMEQVLINLVMNARDAMPNGGRIVIRSERIHGPSVCLSISDTGTGIEPETMRHIFEPFFTTKEQGRGTGLGLATTYGIVKQYHGEISVESQLGKGTTFRILLPEVPAEPVPARSVPTPVETTRETATVLIAEDENIVRKVIKRTLERRGYSVLAASSGEEAINICRTYDGPIHLLLTDVVMPGMNGPALAGEARAMRPDMAILYMSGYSEDIMAHRGMLDSNIPFIEKSFSEQVLAQKVRDVLKSRSPSVGEAS